MCILSHCEPILFQKYTARGNIPPVSNSRRQQSVFIKLYKGKQCIGLGGHLPVSELDEPIKLSIENSQREDTASIKLNIENSKRQQAELIKLYKVIQSLGGHLPVSEWT